MNEQIKNIRNTRIREIADKCVKRTTGDFGMVIEGGVDLEKFAESLIRECMRMCEVAQVGYLTHGLEKEASGAISVKQYIVDYLGVE